MTTMRYNRNHGESRARKACVYKSDVKIGARSIKHHNGFDINMKFRYFPHQIYLP